ncbi:hypothetical protein JVU11DRAFT_7594 [Chiua virens]|nr:hypothetical protein JVU11DRAFT_7594 [Chiua virens]
MDPYSNFVAPSSQASGVRYSQTTQSIVLDSRVHPSLHPSASEPLSTAYQRSYSFPVPDDQATSLTPQVPGTNYAHPLRPPVRSEYDSSSLSLPGHPHRQGRVRHRASVPYQRWNPPPSATVSAPAPASGTMNPYDAVIGDPSNNFYHDLSQSSPPSWNFPPYPASALAPQPSAAALNTHQTISTFAASQTFSEEMFPLEYQTPPPPPPPVDQADIDFVRRRYSNKRCFYQCRFDLAGSPCNQWIVGDRTRVLRHLRNHHHLQTGPALPAVCRWEKCTHSRPMKQENLSRHVVMHLGVKWKCPHCKRLFSRDDAVHRHIERMAPDMDVTDAEVVPGCEARAIIESPCKRARIA